MHVKTTHARKGRGFSNDVRTPSPPAYKQPGACNSLMTTLPESAGNWLETTGRDSDAVYSWLPDQGVWG